MDKPNTSTLRIVLLVSVLINVILGGFLGFKYLNHDNIPNSKKNMINKTNSGDTKFFLGRDDVLKKLPNDSNEVIMLGNSLTHNFEWHEIFPTSNIKNRGINGDVTAGVLQRLTEITESNPNKVFIEIGINDIQQGVATTDIINNYRTIIKQIQANTPSTKIFAQSILPTSIKLFSSDKNIIDEIKELNEKLILLCEETNINFIDLYPSFNLNGELNPKFDCGDHLHLNGDGYLKWCELIAEYVLE